MHTQTTMTSMAVPAPTPTPTIYRASELEEREQGDVQRCGDVLYIYTGEALCPEDVILRIDLLEGEERCGSGHAIRLDDILRRSVELWAKEIEANPDAAPWAEGSGPLTHDQIVARLMEETSDAETYDRMICREPCGQSIEQWWDAVPAGTPWREAVVISDDAVVLREDEVSHPTDRYDDQYTNCVHFADRSGDEPATHIYEVWTDSRDGWAGRGHRVAIEDLADELRDKYAQELLDTGETGRSVVDDAYAAYLNSLEEGAEETLDGIRQAIDQCDLYLEESTAEKLFEMASEAIREPVVILAVDDDEGA